MISQQPWHQPSHQPGYPTSTSCLWTAIAPTGSLSSRSNCCSMSWGETSSLSFFTSSLHIIITILTRPVQLHGPPQPVACLTLWEKVKCAETSRIIGEKKQYYKKKSPWGIKSWDHFSPLVEPEVILRAPPTMERMNASQGCCQCLQKMKIRKKSSPKKLFQFRTGFNQLIRTVVKKPDPPPLRSSWP